VTLTKADLVDSIYNQVGLSKAKSLKAVESLLEIIKKTLENGRDILVSGFGKFCVKDKNERRGRNPRTGEGLMLESRRVATFRCSRVLRDKINAKG